MPRLRLLPPVESVMTQEQAVPVLEHLMLRGGPIAIDTETTGLRILSDHVLFWSMATEDRRWFFPRSLLSLFVPLFRRKDVVWYLANAKFDAHMLKNEGISIAGSLWDIVTMDAMDDDTRPHGLKEQTKRVFGHAYGDFKDLFLDAAYISSEIGWDKEMTKWFSKQRLGDKLLRVYAERPDIVENYATCDAYFTYLDAEHLIKRLSSFELPTDVSNKMITSMDYFRIIEVPLTRSLWNMERRGVNIDIEYQKSIDSPMRDGIASAMRRVHEALGRPMTNIKSDDELASILYGELKLKAIAFTKTGDKSTKAKVLEILRERAGYESKAGKFIGAILAYKHVEKLHSTFVSGLSKHLYQKGDQWKIHCNFNQAVARTSRLSSSNPNLQNIPVRGDEFKIRGMFVASPDHMLIDYDYPQIEFRVAAWLANEEKMMEPIRNGWDIHSANAVNMFGARDSFTYEQLQEARRKKESKEEVSKEEKMMLTRRDQAKTAGLGTLYLMGPRNLANQLKTDIDTAKGIQSDFLSSYEHIDGHMQSCISFAREFGFSHTALGRTRKHHAINNEINIGAAKAEERKAYNMNVQGTSAEMMKFAILQIDNDADFKSLGGHCLLTVHDEIVCEAPHDTAKEVSEIMRERMADPFRWGPIGIDLPLPVAPDGQIGRSWSDVK